MEKILSTKWHARRSRRFRIGRRRIDFLPTIDAGIYLDQLRAINPEVSWSTLINYILLHTRDEQARKRQEKESSTLLEPVL